MKQQRPTSDDKKRKKKANKKRGKMHAMYVYIAQWTELHEEIRKSQQPIDLKHTDAESQKMI